MSTSSSLISLERAIDFDHFFVGIAERQQQNCGRIFFFFLQSRVSLAVWSVFCSLAGALDISVTYFRKNCQKCGLRSTPGAVFLLEHCTGSAPSHTGIRGLYTNSKRSTALFSTKNRVFLVFF